MKVRIKSSQDFWSGFAFLAFGLLTAILSRSYPLGSASRMGAGYFPTMLGLLLAGIGIVVLLRAVASEGGGKVGHVDLWLVVRLLLSVAAFGAFLHPLGLVGAAFVTVLVAARAGPDFRLVEAIFAAVLLAVASWLVFVVALKQTMPVWPAGLA
jgi:Tripartite tricarboxylate transporter TctB family